MRTVLVSLLCLALVAGCCGQPASFRAAAVAAPAAAPCVAAAPAPVMTYAAPQPVAMELRMGAMEHARAALAVPADVVSCFTDGAAKGLILLGDTLRCATDRLWPRPQPSAYAIYPAAPPTVAFPIQMVAPAAAPCR